MQSYATALRKLADRLDKEYFPVTTTLCSNAVLQANWLYEKETGYDIWEYVRLCDQLNEKLTKHISICRTMLLPFIDQQGKLVRTTNDAHYTNVNILLRSKSQVKQIINRIRELDEPATEWKSIYKNLCIKLVMLNRLLEDLFKIEEKDLVPLLKRQNYKYLLLMEAENDEIE